MTPNRYLPPPQKCETVKSIVERDGGEWTPLNGSPERAYRLPEHASAEVRDFLRSTNVPAASGNFIARVPNGRVFGSGIVLSGDGLSIARDVSVNFGKPFEEHWLLNYEKIRPPIPIPGSTAVVATTLSSGYSHWLLEELPRLLALKGTGFESVIAHSNSGFSREAFASSGVSAHIIEPARYSHFTCEQLIVPSLIGHPGFPTTETVRLLDEFTARLGRTRDGCGEKLYISREGARRRRVLNDDELWRCLESRGFAKILTENLGWSDQIALFREAKVIVAPHGAGLANLVFCRPGTRVVELFGRTYVNGCYWRLSDVKGLDYRPVVTAGSGPLGFEISANRNDLVADISAVGEALDAY